MRVNTSNLDPAFSFAGFLNSFEELQAEECGILNGCENGRCVRVQEGYTCDCFDGYHLDMAKMTCVGKKESVQMKGFFPGIPCDQFWSAEYVSDRWAGVAVWEDEKSYENMHLV